MAVEPEAITPLIEAILPGISATEPHILDKGILALL
jgi:hypothetical protein